MVAGSGTKHSGAATLVFRFIFFIFTRKSPLKMEYLQERIKKVQQEKGLKQVEQNLILDVKTRWNSLIGMLDSVLRVSFSFFVCGYQSVFWIRIPFYPDPDPAFFFNPDQYPGGTTDPIRIRIRILDYKREKKFAKNLICLFLLSIFLKVFIQCYIHNHTILKLISQQRFRTV